MGEAAVVEDAGIEKLVDEPVERTTEREDYAESKPIREDYKSEARRSDTKTSADKKSEKKRGKRGSSVSAEDLEKLIGDDDVYFTKDENGRVVAFYNGKMVYGDGYPAPTRFKGKKSGKSEARQVHDSYDGVHAIIYHRDPETGEIFFAFEKKPQDYPIPEHANKASLYGGSIQIGESPIEALPRELKEEDPASHKTIVNALNETRRKVAEITKNVNGVPSSTYIYAAEIKNPAKWAAYKSTKSTEGDKLILNLEQVLQSNDFAFGFGPYIKEFANSVNRSYFTKMNYTKMSPLNAFYNSN